ncbi:MAG: CoB--CoM heterodisulfide reductase iron-sulfur subunit A family protein [Promethearchaeota archaeon]
MNEREEKGKERQVEEPRIGVFVCHCGSNIGGIIDCKALSEYAKTLPNVVYSEDNLYTCSEIGLSNIKKAIKEHDLNRVIVASCTPRTHEPLFRETVAEVGLNPYLFHFVNIRDQCTWVHMKEPDKAYEKAVDLIRMGVAQAAKLEPLDKNVVTINSSALILGGGVAGMTAANSLARQGFQVYLVEKEDKLGGRLNQLDTLFPSGLKASELLRDIQAKLDKLDNLEIFTSARVTEINGFVGNFEVNIQQGKKTITVTVGAIIVAVGASMLDPTGLYSYDGKTVITQLELEGLLKGNSVDANDIVMIQCVGARDGERNYCSATCCMSAIKNAIEIKKHKPGTNITILHRDIYSPGIANEQLYRKARALGVVFLKYDLDRKPAINDITVKVYSKQINDEVSIPYDLIVLSTPMVAHQENKDLGQLLKVPLQEHGFFLEAHVKLRPVDFATDGVFVCGCAKWPVDINESIIQGYAAAARASRILSHDEIEVEGATAYLPEENKDLCIGCEVCITVCPFKAIIKNENDEIEVIQALCKGCGTCAATCAQNAIVIRHFKTEQILASIYALSEGGVETR